MEFYKLVRVKMGLRRIILDVLKPIRNPGIEDLALELENLPGVDGVNITVKEIDVETLTLTIVIEGESINFKLVKEKLEENGAVIHSVDQVIAGKRMVEIPYVYLETQ